jgi:hypothetical protein
MMISLGKRVVMAAAVVFTTLLCAEGNAQPWDHAHADRSNRGFVPVLTRPAETIERSVQGVGTFALGAGPVIAADGTIYLGTQEGKLIALHADGSAFWHRDLPRGNGIAASPVIGADGTIYVIGTRTVRDHRGGGPPRIIATSALFTFAPGGGWISQVPFPTHHGFTGRTTAPPSIFSVAGREIVLVSAMYPSAAGRQLRLLGFEKGGAMVVDAVLSDKPLGPNPVPGVSVDPACAIPVFSLFCAICGDIGCSYDPERAGPLFFPKPQLSVFGQAGRDGGDAIWVIANNGFDTLSIATLTVGGGSRLVLSPASEIYEPGKKFLSAPMTLPSGRSLFGAEDAVRFAGPVQSGANPIAVHSVYGAPTMTNSGTVVAVGIVEDKPFAYVLRDDHAEARTLLPGASYVAAAASRSNVYVSTTNALVTLDAGGARQVATFGWTGGGTNPPAIGPDGRIYAIADDALLIFPGRLPHVRPLPHVPDLQPR